MYPNGQGENLSVHLEINATESAIKRIGNTTETCKILDITLEYDAIFDVDDAIMVNSSTL